MKRAVALGVFDGLHRAHQAVLQEARSKKQEGMTPAAMLFPAHPLTLLRGEAPPLLLTDEERDAMLRRMGLELLFTPFEEIHALEPEVFFREILIDRFNAGAVCCGYHYHFGANANGDVPLLRRLCDEHGLEISVVPRMEYRGEAISATRIRAALARGDLADANAMLGRPFGYTLRVVEGERIGRALGAPTLNQMFGPGFCVPKYGVYQSEALIEGEWRASVTNIGLRPSVDKQLQLRSETHAPGYEGDIYGREISVRLLRFLREERRFGSFEELKKQIRRDIEIACGAAEIEKMRE